MYLEDKTVRLQLWDTAGQVKYIEPDDDDDDDTQEQFHKPLFIV